MSPHRLTLCCPQHYPLAIPTGLSHLQENIGQPPAARRSEVHGLGLIYPMFL